MQKHEAAYKIVRQKPKKSVMRVIKNLAIYASSELAMPEYYGYYLTFRFSKLKGSNALVKARMHSEMERVYAASSIYLMRNARLRENDEVPVWIACPDGPALEYERSRQAKATSIDGLKAHAIAFIPSELLIAPFDEHLLEESSIYVQPPLVEISTKQIDDPKHLYTYCRKRLRRIMTEEGDAREYNVHQIAWAVCFL